MQPDGDGVELSEVAVDSLETTRWRVHVPEIAGAEPCPGRRRRIRRWRVTGGIETVRPFARKASSVSRPFNERNGQ